MRNTALTRRNHPFTGVIESLFDDAFFPPAYRSLRTQEDADNQTWFPPVDLAQNEQGYQLTADLPGLSKDDINLTVEDNVLTLSGERTFENREKGQYDRIERAYGKFSRTFHLPSTVDSSGVKASFKDGVLTVEIPKAEKARSRQIKIG